MLFEDVVLAIVVGVLLLIVGSPIVRFLKTPWRQRDPLVEAQERLRIAQREAEAAKVNREAEKIYEQLYEEALAEDHGRVDARVASDEPGDVRAADDAISKGKR